MKFTTRPLSIADSREVQACYDSQPKLMLIEKSPDEAPYAGVFEQLLLTGCVAFGAYANDELRAFVVFWPWPSLPASTLVLMVNRPDGMIYNPERSGLQAALDAGIASMEAEGRSSIYFARAAGGRWKNSTIKRRLGRLSEYHFLAVERVEGGKLARFPAFNQLILGGRPLRGDAIIGHALAPQVGDF